MRAKHWMWTVLFACVAAAAGWGARDWLTPSRGSDSHGGSASAEEGPCPGGASPLYWKAPMDPTYVRDKPGKSPMGMDLVPVCPGGESSPESGGVAIDPAMVQTIGVRTARVGKRDLARRIRSVGRVDYDERRVAHVHTKIQGWVEKLHVEYEGQMVKAGQPLLEIYSPELVSTQEELLIAGEYRDVTGKSSFDDVKRGGRELFAATRRRLELWDIPDRDIDRLLETGKVHKTLTLYAPTAGVVTHLKVRNGMEVGPNDNLYTIADLDHVWVYADVYEYELPWVHEGQQGIVELSYLPGQRFRGRVTYVYPFLDPKTRTARVRLELPNPGIVLKPDMFANVTIETEKHAGVLAVPEEAVIRSGQRNMVIVTHGEGRFEPREVELGLDSGDGWLEVKSGLTEGERVVTSGQFLIDSESKLREAVQKLLSPTGEDTKGATPAQEGHAMPEGMKMPSAGTPPSGHEGMVHPGGPMPHEGHAMPRPPASGRE